MKMRVVLALAFGWLAGVGVADEGLEAWKAAYPAKLDAIQTLQEKAEFRTEMSMGGMKSVQIMEMEFVYRRPDGLKAKGPFMEVYCLGTNAVVHETMMKKSYHRQTVEEGMAGLLEVLNASQVFLQSDKQVLLKTDEEGRAEALDEMFTSEDARQLPGEELEGRKCDVFVDQLGNMFQEQWAKIWVDAETGLLRRIESIPTPEWVAAEEAAAEDAEMMKMYRDRKLVYVVLEQRLNEPVADEAFAFVPQEGDEEEVVTPEEVAEEKQEKAIEKETGLQRFALSGQAAPDFELPLLAGGVFKLAEQKGKVVVIDFWATWCGPCVRALPEMKQLAEDYADNPDVVVVGFSTDAEKSVEKVRELVKSKGLGYAIGLGPEDAKAAYKVSGIPCVVVIGKDGVVQGRRVGYSETMGKDLKKAVAALLAGETLESAAPYTAEELKKLEEGICPKCGKKHEPSSFRPDTKKIDERMFKLRWSQDAKGAERMDGLSFGTMSGVEAKIAPSRILRVDQGRATVLDAADGKVLQTVELPAAMSQTNEMGRNPYLVYLRTPEGGAIASYQEHYQAKKTGTSTSFKTQKIELTGLALAGGAAWTNAVKESDSVRSLSALPVSAEEDLLAATSWRAVCLYNAKGEVVLKQELEYGTQAYFAQDREGKLVLYVLDKKVSLYDVVWPLPPEAPAPKAD